MTTLRLGDFVFDDMEIPDEIPLGGSQSLSVKQLVGGRRIIDTMGRTDRPLEWSGLFIGRDAFDRARQLDGMRIAGKALKFSLGELAMTVVIADFEYRYMSGRYPYRITCEVVSDDASPVSGLASLTIDDMLGGDMASAVGLGAKIGDSPLSGLLSTLGGAVGGVSSFAKAASGTINSVLQPLAAVQDRVQTLIGQTGRTIDNLTSLGGVLPTIPAVSSAINLLGSVSSMTQLSDLYDLRSVTGRMTKNLDSVQSSGAEIIVSGAADLYDLAATAYGDASEWSSIARANGLTDPVVAGGLTILIPTQPDGADGVFQT